MTAQASQQTTPSLVHCGGGSPTTTLVVPPTALVQSIPRAQVVPIARLEGPSLACAAKQLELAEAAAAAGGGEDA